MSTTPEVPFPILEAPKAPELQSEIPESVEQGQPIVTQQAQVLTRPTTTVATTTQKPTTAQSVTIPADPAQLTTLAKGNPVNALTWFAAFWLRMIKKALSMGAGIMTSQSIKIPASNTQQSNASTQVLPTQPQISDPNPALDQSQTNIISNDTTPDSQNPTTSNN